MAHAAVTELVEPFRANVVFGQEFAAALDLV
jgi:hypothetical protein